MKPFPCEIRRVECDQLIPVEYVADTETAFAHIQLLKKQYPGDYLIFEQAQTRPNGDPAS